MTELSLNTTYRHQSFPRDTNEIATKSHSEECALWISQFACTKKHDVLVEVMFDKNWIDPRHPLLERQRHMIGKC